MLVIIFSDTSHCYGFAASRKRNNKNTVSCREYYNYKLQIRSFENSILLHSGRLLQQYVVDMYVKFETSRLDYFRLNQKAIRAELYQGIIDSIEHGETHGSQVGQRIIFPSSFIGCPRDMKKRYMDAMTLVKKFGKPDIFLTMTCNPNWPEIKEELQRNDEVHNRPDLVVRIFKAKLEELKIHLFKRQIFGQVGAHVYVIEFQKRVLLHAHFLIILKSNSKLYAPECFDKVVSRKIPHCHLYAMILKHMIHGPCGNLNPTNACMTKKGNCRNHYPKSFCLTTTQGENSYPKYRRQDDKQKIQVRGATLDNVGLFHIMHFYLRNLIVT
ncbi:uncharacterized protein LOC133778880 [Humulus lupulus]|uniref:uncharacterized protein LOC133778880 n=1 Tax=Humulus lupulus TaxID=3486 RepID=UPI002B401E79|nr:uncharacterized protein LOC133778880 [Humulus lupulus]